MEIKKIHRGTENVVSIVSSHSVAITLDSQVVQTRGQRICKFEKTLPRTLFKRLVLSTHRRRQMRNPDQPPIRKTSNSADALVSVA